jgi:hypothetical protein
MLDWRIKTGALTGLLGFVLANSLCSPGLPQQETGPLLGDGQGALMELVVQAPPAGRQISLATYRAFLQALPSGLTVRVLVEKPEHFTSFETALGPLACELRPLITGHPITTWARDRWLSLEPESPGRPVTILAPREEAGARVWPERAGDQRVALSIERALIGQVRATRSVLAFDGGDFVADEHTVFVTPAVLRRNLGSSVDTAEALVDHLERITHKRVILLPEAPEHHAGMFMMPVGDKTLLVGDPSLAAGLEDSSGWPLSSPDFGQETQARFDAVARACTRAGYRVVRMPVVPDRDGRTWLTPLNGILEQRDGKKRVFMPVYDGAMGLAAEATRIWKDLGYQVMPIDCSATYRHFGSLRCLVNVLRRTRP